MAEQGEAASPDKSISAKGQKGGRPQAASSANAAISSASANAETASGKGNASALSNAEQRALKKTLQSTERKMRTCETRIQEATDRLHEADPTDFQALGSIQKEIDDLRGQLEELELVWLETAESLGL